MATIGKGVVEVVYDKNQAEKSARDAILPGLGRVAGDMAGVFAGKKIFDFAKQGFEEVGAAQKVSAQTVNVLKNLGSTAGVTQGDVEDLSASMLKQSGVDDELAQSAANTALRLGVQGDQMKRVVQDANDLSQSFGDITSDSELLSKALAKPESAAKLLKPAIGALTDEQTKSIASFVAVGDKASAQGVILDAVEAKTRGAAAAFGQTLPGEMAIAEQSLANMKGELTAGMAPALAFGAEGVTFLTDEFDKLPPSAQAAIGTVGLVGAGVVSLARPVGDVVRLYQTWRQRSEEVAAATAALAQAEATEAAASAASAASTASSTAVTVASTAVTNESAVAAAKRIVSNEALVFSDAEIVAAEQARQLAEARSLVSNDALIAADMEMVAANEAAAASAVTSGTKTSSMSSTLGKAGLVAAAAAAAFGLYEYGQSLNDVNFASDAALTKLTKLDSEAIRPVARSFSLLAAGGGELANQARDALDRLADMGAAGVGTLEKLRQSAADAGLDTKVFDDAIAKAKTSQDNLNDSAAQGSKILDGLSDSTSVAASEAPDFIAAVNDEKKALDEAAAAAKNLDDTFKSMVDGTLSEFEAQLQLNEAQVASRTAVEELDKVSKNHKSTKDELTSSTDKALSTIINEAKANEALYEAQVKATGGTVEAATANQKLIEELFAVASTLDPKSPLRQQLGEYITKLQSVPGNVTSVANFDSSAAVQAVIDFQRALAGIPASVDTSANFRYQIGPRAKGGPVGPNEIFRGGEQGFEILFKDSVYQAPPNGGFVMPHDQSEMFMSAFVTSSDGSAEPVTIVVPLYINDREFARATVHATADELRQHDRALA